MQDNSNNTPKQEQPKQPPVQQKPQAVPLKRPNTNEGSILKKAQDDELKKR